MKHLLLTTIAAVLLVGTAFADPIHEAAANGDLAGVQAELDKGVDVNAKDENDEAGWTPLHRAAQKGHKEITELLIANGADVNAKEEDGWTPLHYAALNGHKEIAELLIAKGADVNAKEEDGWTPLHYAAYGGHKETAELLIAKGADVNAKTNNGITPLDYAEGEIADLLRKHGGKTGGEFYRDNKLRNELLQKAAGDGNIEAVKQQFAAGADVDAKGGMLAGTPLHYAAIKGHKEVVELLIAAGADVNAKDIDEWTPLHRAADAGHKEVAELLIAKGALVNAKDRVGETPLDFAINKNRTETADLLREHGGKTGEELNALLDAAKKGDIEAVKQHLAAGADVNEKAGDGTTPLHNAAVYGHKEVAELLLANGAEVNAIIVSGRNQGKTPLDLAIWRKKTETADLLRKHGGRTAEELALMPRLEYGKDRWPFGFSFNAKDGMTYVVEVTQDFKQWGELETIEGTGKQVKFIDPRQPLVQFKRNFYRVKVVD